MSQKYFLKKDANMITQNKKPYLIVRILGNDLKTLHGNNQTINNLQFTLQNEKLNTQFDTMYILNRIHDTNKVMQLKKILNDYNQKYKEIPFDYNEFKKLPKLFRYNFDFIKNSAQEYQYQSITIPTTHLIKRMLMPYNLYLINNNGCRNYAIEFGKLNNYTWTFPLDSNSFLMEYQQDDIIKNLKDKTDYIILPQIRIKNNNDIYDKQKILSYDTKEAQIGFKYTSELCFNNKIPYGACPKAELLKVMNVPGQWQKWRSHTKLYNISDRPKENANWQIFLGGIIRLYSYNIDNNLQNNVNNRTLGLYKLIKDIQKKYAN